MGYHDAADFFGVYVWEYMWEVSNAIHGDPPGEPANLMGLFEERPAPQGILVVGSRSNLAPPLLPEMGTVIGEAVGRDLTEGLAGKIRKMLGQALCAHGIAVEIRRDEMGRIDGLTFTMPHVALPPGPSTRTVVL